MNRLGPVFYWWGQRSRREQLLVGVCGALIAATALWLLAVRPLQHWREAREDALAVALAEETAVRSVLAGAEPQPDRAAADLGATVTETAAAAGLAPVLGMSQSGDLGFTLAGASSGQSLSWLTELERRGVRTRSLSIVENADATVTVEGALSAR